MLRFFFPKAVFWVIFATNVIVVLFSKADRAEISLPQPSFCTTSDLENLILENTDLVFQPRLKKETGLIENLVDVRSGCILKYEADCLSQNLNAGLCLRKIYDGKSWNLRSALTAFYDLQTNQIFCFDKDIKLGFSCPNVTDQKIADVHWWNSAKKKKKIKVKNVQKQQVEEQFYPIVLNTAETLEQEKTNKLDYVGRIDGQKEHFELITPDGRQLFYKAVLKFKNKESHEILTDRITYLLEREILPEKIVLHYEYDHRKRISSIKAYNFLETKVLSRVNFNYHNPYLLDCDFDAVTSEGMIWNYFLERRKKQVFLRKVKNNAGLEYSYSYVPYKDRYLLKTAGFIKPAVLADCAVEEPDFKFLVEKEKLPAAICQNQSFAFEYYPEKSGQDLKVKAIFSQNLKGKKELLYSFKYLLGKTQVIDYAGCTKVFYYDQQKRIYQIDFFNVQDELIYSDRFIFKDGLLISQYRLNQDMQTFSAYLYNYDANRKLISQSLIGSFSKDQKPLQFDQKKMPVLSSEIESDTISWQYNQDQELVLETHGFLQIKYGYKDGELVNRLVFDQNRLIKRFFYAYDEDGFLAEIVQDDGIDEKKANFVGITERKCIRFQRIKEDLLYGFLKQKEEFYLDLDTNRYKLLRKTLFTYSPSGKISKEKHLNASGKELFEIERVHDENQRLCSLKNSKGKKIYFSYDALGRLIRIFDGQNRLEYRYQDENGNMTVTGCFAAHDGRKKIFSKKFDLLGRLIEEENGFQNKTSYNYDEMGFLVAKQLPSCLNEEGEETDIVFKYVFDVWGNQILSINPLAQETAYSYNPRGEVIKIKYPDSSQKRFAYYEPGGLRYYIDPIGVRTCYKYDGQKRLVERKKLSPQGKKLASEAFEYNSCHLTARIDPMGRISRYFFDYAGRLIKEVQGRREFIYAYNDLNQICSKKVENGENSYTVYFTYASDGSLLQERIGNLNNSVLFSKKYEKTNNCLKILRPNSQKLFLYDSLGRLIKKENSAHQQSTSYEYLEDYENILGQKVLQIRKKDKNQNTIKTYDALGRLVQKEKKEPLYKEENFFDAASYLRKKRIIDFCSEGSFLQEIFYEYKVNGCLAKKSIAWPFSEKTFSYDYDAKGKIVKLINPSEEIIEKSYDFLGNLQALKAKKANYSFKYNPANELMEVKNLKTQKNSSFVRDEFGQVIKEDLENGLKLGIQRDALGRCVQIALPDGSDILFNWSVLSLEGSGRAFNRQLLYEHFLSSKKLSSNYDRQMDSWKEVIGGMDNLAYEFDLEKQKIRISSSFFYQDLPLNGSENNQDVVKNANGDIIFKQGFYGPIEYEYDGLGRLILEKNGSHKIVYAYDGLGRKMQKTVYLLKDEGKLKSYELYLYFGDQEIGLWNSEDKFLKLKIEGDLLRKDFSIVLEKIVETT